MTIWFGGDYNPEQWDAAVWAEDDELMRAARVNTATVGVFSWSLLEPEEGQFEFGWLDSTLDRLHRNGVRVILATPTASPPPWFTLAHPDAMPVRPDGTRLWHGSRDTYCAAAPAYRQAAVRIAGALAGRYADHPALAMWHVHNEYGTLCWCDYAAAAFRDWLRRRYGAGADGLAALNQVWGTACWSQHYSAWEQVLPPRATQYLPNPGQDLDFRRFWSAELLAAFTEQRDVVRQRCHGVPVTTNFVPADWAVTDPWTWGGEVDVFAIDHYLTMTGPGGHADIAFTADLARSAGGGKPWLLMEQAASVVVENGLMMHREPGRMLRDSLGYVAHGADGVCFFQWRASRAGAEMHHPALVPHAGRDTRIFAEAVSLGTALERLSEVTGSVLRAETAVLVDTDSSRALESRGLPSDKVRHLDVARSVHAALWRAGIACDLAPPPDLSGDLSGYRLVLVPAVYLMSDETAAALCGYVAAGGHLVVTFLSGIADQFHRIRTGGYPGALRDLLGLRVEEFHPLPLDATVALAGFDGAAGTVWSERLRTAGCEVVARYSTGMLAGLPAVTRNRVGGGVAWYVSTWLADSALDWLLRCAAAAAGVQPVLADLPRGVAVSRRHGNDGTSWLFAFNHTAEPVTLPAAGVDLLTGKAASPLCLPARGAAVLRETAQAGATGPDS